MKVVKLSVVLLLICAVVAGILGGVNAITEERIASQKAQKAREAYEAVLLADTYEPLDFDKSQFPTVTEVVRAGGGHVVKLVFSGAQGSITMAVGIDENLRCTGISIIDHSETSGLGANAAADSEVGRHFREQFIGQEASIALSTQGGDIDALTGATITTTAVVKAVATAIAAAAAERGVDVSAVLSDQGAEINALTGATITTSASAEGGEAA